MFKANEIIGFQTIQNMSLQHLSNFKDKTINELANFDYMHLKYEVIDKTKREAFNKVNYCINNSDQEKIKNQFYR